MTKKLIRFIIRSAPALVITWNLVIPGAMAENEETFVKILEKSYKASCEDVEGLRDYYLPEAEIIHNGRQKTLSETIDQLSTTLGGMKGLACGYKPRVQGSYITEDFAFMTLRETVQLKADEIQDIEIQQICTYIFLKKKGKWMITHDHCSEIEGQTV